MNTDEADKTLVLRLRGQHQSLLDIYKAAGGKKFQTKSRAKAATTASVLIHAEDSSAVHTLIQADAYAVHSFLEIAKLHLDSIESENCKANSESVPACEDGAGCANAKMRLSPYKSLCVEMLAHLDFLQRERPHLYQS
jgi:hypothetical protein